MDVIRIPILVPDAPLAMRLAVILSVYLVIRLIVSVYLFIRRLIQG